MPARVLGLCGSLRARSRSAALLRAARLVSPLGLDLQIFAGLGELPLFNPDLEPVAPPAVHAFWQAVQASEALLIISPEYAHGVTAVMKNALDWLVGYAPVVGKPAAVVNPAARARHADASLKEILCTMNLHLIDAACVCIDVVGSTEDEHGISTSDEWQPSLVAMWAAVAEAVSARQHERVA